MNINFVLSNTATIDPAVDINRLKELGSFWGSWQTWRSCQTDNVICHDQKKAHELITRSFHTSCNLYIPETVFVALDRPAGVKLYAGEFIHEVDNQEEIVAMHLAANTGDIVLLLGFDFRQMPKLEDTLAEHRAHNYRSLTRQVILDNPNTQWVVLDHLGEFRKDLENLPNLGHDTLSNIIQS